MAIETFQPRAAHDAMSAEPDSVFVDVRTPEEYEQGHPDKAINVPWAVIDATTGQMAHNAEFLGTVQKHFAKDCKLYLSCQAGMRSLNACKELEAAGYSRLVNIDGGFGGRRDPGGQLVVPGWVDAGLPVETSPSNYTALR